MKVIVDSNIVFIALSLYLDLKLWTGDKRLIEGLISKGFTNCLTTTEMLMLRKE